MSLELLTTWRAALTLQATGAVFLSSEDLRGDE
jgi:hypothetical protein